MSRSETERRSGETRKLADPHLLHLPLPCKHATPGGKSLQLLDDGDSVRPPHHVGLLGVKQAVLRLRDDHIVVVFYHPLGGGVGVDSVAGKRRPEREGEIISKPKVNSWRFPQPFGKCIQNLSWAYEICYALANLR